MASNARDFLVRLRDFVCLDVRARTPERACEIISDLHPALAAAILAAGTEEEMILVRGRCLKCGGWVLSKGLDNLSKVVECGVCHGGAQKHDRTRAVTPVRPLRPDRRGGPDHFTTHDDPDFLG